MGFRNYVAANEGRSCKTILREFYGKFPTLEALANADDEEVLKAWEGLGYYSRARNLHAAVKEVKSIWRDCAK